MKPPHEIEIIGGGLAGLSLGLALRRAGVAVVLHEAGAYPLHRVCGEFIAGLDASTIAQLGLQSVLEGALLHREVAWFLPQEPARIQRLPAPALGLSRHALDARLATAFVAAGGDLRTKSRIPISDAPAGRVFATGRRRHSHSPWLGLKLHVQGLELERELELHLGAGGYVGLARLPGGEVNLCALFRRGPVGGRGSRLIDAHLRAAGLTGLAQRLESAVADPDSFAAVAALGFDRSVPDGSRVCLGDTCAMIPPFTGNGMAMAFQSAAIALDPLLAYARGQNTWLDTRRQVNAALHSHFRRRLAAAHMLHPILLRSRWQRWLGKAGAANLIPFNPLYAVLH